MNDISSFTELKKRKSQLRIEMEESKKEISRISAELNPIKVIKNNIEGNNNLSILKNVTTSLPFSFVILPKLVSFLPIKTKWKIFLKGIPLFYNYILPTFQKKKKEAEHRL